MDDLIKKQAVSDIIVEDIVDQIKNGRLKAGDKLPNEKDMAERYGVSRISVREALRWLAAKGLVVTKHGEGTHINHYDPGAIADTFYSYTLLDDTPVLEMLELRKIMESEAARLACANATPQEIERIREYKEAREHYYRLSMEQSESVELKNEYDTKFHMAIAQATHNSMFERFIDIIHRTLEIQQRKAAAAGGISDTTFFHDEIYKAIAARDGDRAHKMMYRHIEQVERLIRKSLQEKQGGR